MWAVDKFFTLTKLVLLLLGRVVVKLVHMGTSRCVKIARSLMGLPRVDLENGDKQLQLLRTESIDAAQENLADEWVTVPEADNWEPNGRNLLDDYEKPRRDASESHTEDELIELSDDEDRSTHFTLLQSVKRSNSNPLSDRARNRLIAPNLFL
ncbi:hypothetical protein PHMEG_0006959 [Phytophthora megakarya]|uniref:Reverse transcriptase n=1 Tax=Phytophthora megakarya TaxID=4795 RepID=A0A225WML7_9STRA|nr:hypothetical protein PHMEG_0006959 [Phytophthora megakarya]